MMEALVRCISGAKVLAKLATVIGLGNTRVGQATLFGSSRHGLPDVLHNLSPVPVVSLRVVYMS